jgi:hypothetical protein
MSQTITIRLTPTRALLLKSLKQRFNLKNSSEAVELALRMSFKDDIDCKAKIEKVAGCMGGKGRKNSVT